MNKQEKIIWAAGFIDADGTITIKRSRRGKHKKWNFIAYIAVSQSDRKRGMKALNLLKDLFGGNIHHWTYAHNIKLAGGVETAYKRESVAYWQVTSRAAANCMNQIFPYLVIKKDNGKVLQEFVNKFFRPRKGAKWLTDEQRLEREKYFFKMRTFNVKGALRQQRLSEKTVVMPMQ